MNCLPKLHKSPTKVRFIIACKISNSYFLIKTFIEINNRYPYKLIIKQSESYNTCRFYSRTNAFLNVVNNEHVINKIKPLNKENKAVCMR